MDRRERVSLRRFARYVVSSRAQRRSLVLEQRRLVETEWSPITDPYRFLINAIGRMHENDLGLEALDEAVNRERAPRRRSTIREAAGDYAAWLGQAGPVASFPAVAGDWAFENARVRVNPELGLIIGGQRFLVKLHFAKGSPMTTVEADVMTTVMRETLGSAAPAGCKMAVLDVRRGVLHIEPRASARVLAAARAAAADLAAAWEEVS
jgi:hypothetical protein